MIVATKRKRKRILVLDDDRSTLEPLNHLLKDQGYKVSCASNVSRADILVGFSLTGIKKPEEELYQKFSIAIIDLRVGDCNGGEFGKRLREVAPDVNIIIMTGDPEMASALPFEPDGIFIKGSNPQSLLKMIGELEKPLRTKSSTPIDARTNFWLATAQLPGINALKSFTKEDGCTEKDVIKLTAVTKDGQLVNFVVYPPQSNSQRKIYIGISTLLGCPIACETCLNWRHRHNQDGQEVAFLRQLSKDEINSQVYHAFTTQLAKKIFELRPMGEIVVNFTVEGDVAFNMRNSCEAIKDLSRIQIPKMSFIHTSVGTEASLRMYINDYINLPNVRHYWSLNSLIVAIRQWWMPGTKNENLEVLRGLYQQIAELTGKAVKVSWVVAKGINDTALDAKMLADFLNNRPFEIKLMALIDDNKETKNEDVENFKQKLIAAGVNIPVKIVEIFGTNIFAGCANTTNNQWRTRCS